MSFFEVKGKQTNSGIIFTPHAKSKTHGLIPIRDAISKEISADIGVFASTAPKEFSPMIGAERQPIMQHLNPTRSRSS